MSSFERSSVNPEDRSIAAFGQQMSIPDYKQDEAAAIDAMTYKAAKAILSGKEGNMAAAATALDSLKSKAETNDIQKIDQLLNEHVLLLPKKALAPGSNVEGPRGLKAQVVRDLERSHFNFEVHGKSIYEHPSMATVPGHDATQDVDDRVATLVSLIQEHLGIPFDDAELLAYQLLYVGVSQDTMMGINEDLLNETVSNPDFPRIELTLPNTSSTIQFNQDGIDVEFRSPGATIRQLDKGKIKAQGRCAVRAKYSYDPTRKTFTCGERKIIYNFEKAGRFKKSPKALPPFTPRQEG